jgi:thioredoxin reductase (NADPH)
LQPLLIEGVEAGGQLMLTTMVENYPGYRDGILGPELMAEMRSQSEKFGAEITQGDVTSIDVCARPIVVRTSEAEFAARALIIATGASAKLLGLPAERRLMGHGVSTCATCDGYFFRGQDIAVVGGGDSAMEEAVFLTRFADKVTLVHRRDALRASKIMQDKARANPKIAWMLDTEVEEIQGSGKGEVAAMVVRNRKTNARTVVPVSGVFVAIGHTPNTSVFSGQLEMENGYIVTRGGREGLATATSVPGVFAAGDVRLDSMKRVASAVGEGAMAVYLVHRYLATI